MRQVRADGPIIVVMRVRLLIAYEGTAFHGWQRQFASPSAVIASDDSVGGDAGGGGGGPRMLPAHPLATPSDRKGEGELRTVQAVVQRAACELFRMPLVVQGASRTDAGVHALAQTAVFDVPGDAKGPPAERLADALNARLPGDVLVREAVRVEEGFDPIGDCVEKGYRYRMVCGRKRPLFDRRRLYHTHHALDVAAMRLAAERLVGEHDFAAFAQADHGRESTVRTVTACGVERVDDRRVDVTVSADGFLYNMVRIIAGTLHDVGRGRIDPRVIGRALDSGDRRLSGPTLPPQGLVLEWGRYPEPVGMVGGAVAV